MNFVVDFSFGRESVTPAALAKLTGCVGGIGYAGCADTAKNITKPELDALLAAGNLMALVIENNPTDALGGHAVGVAQGQAIVAAAKALGYDWQNCVLFAGFDANSTTVLQDEEILAFMEGFASVVPIPGYYGDSDSIDYLHVKHPTWSFWQSDSRSFSPKNPSPNTSLQQLYNDPRGGAIHGSVDVNNVLKTPLRFMGENMALTEADAALVAKHVWSDAEGSSNPWTVLTKLSAAVNALTAEVASLKAGAVSGPVKVTGTLNLGS